MRISVVIPVYNVERYVARCLESVLASARVAVAAGHEVEILCVNDGSTDSSAAIVEGFAAKIREVHEPRVSFSVITKENGGLGSARNAGLDRMSGDFVTFVDSDDYILPHTLATFAAIADLSKTALVVSSSFLRDDHPAPLPPATTPRFRVLPAPKIAGRKVQYSAWNKFYRADLFKARRYPPTIFEDFPVTTDIFCAAQTFALVDAPLYVYCLNDGAASLVHSPFSERKLRDSIAVVRMVCETARQQTEKTLRAFAIHQAADGLSSTVSKVFKARSPALVAELLKAVDLLKGESPDVVRALSLKARVRLGLLRFAHGRRLT